MMGQTNEINKLIANYYQWLADNTIVSHDRQTDWFAVNTPFVGLMNDHIEIFVKKVGDKIYLSDDGETIWNLESLGVNVLKSSSRKKILRCIELNYGVKINEKEITSEATIDNFPAKKHALLQAIQQVSDLKMTKKQNVISLFSEDFRGYLDSENVIYTPQFNLIGKSGLSFVFDFQIAGRNDESVIRTFNSLSQSTVAGFLFGIGDIREERENTTGKKLHCMAVINDLERTPDKDFLNALREYDCKPLLWSQKGTGWNVETLQYVS